MIGKSRLAMQDYSVLAEVPSISMEYCEVYKIPRRVGSLWVPWSPGPLYLPTHTVIVIVLVMYASHINLNA